MGLLGFKAKHSLLPPYLQDILSSHHSTRQLRSSSAAHQFFKPAVNSNFASRAFCVSVPSVWNSLKPNLCSIDSSASFKSQLKTTLFLSAYMVALSTAQSHPALLIRFLDYSAL